MLIIIPLYRGAELISDLVASLEAITEEMQELLATVLFVNDSPDDVALKDALARHLLDRETAFSYELLTNSENQGFIKSCNRGLEKAAKSGADAVLLNSDALLTPGCLREMKGVAASDPMIGFVSPRSNNATICNLPTQDRYNEAPFQDAVLAHQQTSCHLPRLTYVPTVVGFCLYIKNAMIVEFGLLDEVYGKGYNEENDFILRCNRRGFRAVLANHAFAYHIGGISFSLTETPTSRRERINSVILQKRFPEYYRSIERYFSGSYYEAEGVLSGFVTRPGEKPGILFECSNIGDYYNGTFMMAVQGIKAFAKAYGNEYDICVCCNLSAYSFHAFDQIDQIRYVGEQYHARKYAPYRYVIRLSQPFTTSELRQFSRLAPIVCVMILDTIGLDCLHLDGSGIEDVWRQLPDMVDAIGYISQFSEDQFLRRFDTGAHMTNFVALLSTDVDEYSTDIERKGQTGVDSGYILVVGNHYAHKHVDETVELVREMHPDRHVVVLGGTKKTEPDQVNDDINMDQETSMVHRFASGALTQSILNELHANCDVLVFPSFYEGFGFPIVDGLSFGKPVLARDTQVSREIKAKSVFGDNIYLFKTTAEIAKASGRTPAWVASDDTIEPQRWHDFADNIQTALKEAERRFDFGRLTRRIELSSWHGRGAPISRHPAAVSGRLIGAAVEKGLMRASRIRAFQALGRAIWGRRKAVARLLRLS